MLYITPTNRGQKCPLPTNLNYFPIPFHLALNVSKQKTVQRKQNNNTVLIGSSSRSQRRSEQIFSPTPILSLHAACFSLQEEDGTESSGEESTGSAGEVLASSANLGNSGGSLDLAVTDLSNGSTSRGLDLAVTNLSDGSARGDSSRSLDLTIIDLGDGSTGRSLDLTVTNLRDGGEVSGSLDLAITNLGDRSTGSLVAGGGDNLDLTVGNLLVDLAQRNGDHGGVNLGLAVANGGDDSGLHHAGSNGGLAGVASRLVAVVSAARGGDELNRLALLSPVLVVEVVEVTRQALVEDGGGAEGNGAVVAGRETASVDGAGLGRAVKLELTVGDNGAGAALAVPEDTVVESQDEGGVFGAVALLDLAALLLATDSEDANLELVGSSERAALGGLTLGSNTLLDTLGNSQDGGSEAKSSSGELHFVYGRIGGSAK